MYKIRNKQGLFSTGSTRPSFKKSGKLWTTKRALMAHLAQFKNKGQCSMYSDCEIVEYKLIENGIEPLTLWIFSAYKENETEPFVTQYFASKNIAETFAKGFEQLHSKKYHNYRGEVTPSN